jgi:hypothetical protein
MPREEKLPVCDRPRSEFSIVLYSPKVQDAKKKKKTCYVKKIQVWGGMCCLCPRDNQIALQKNSAAMGGTGWSKSFSS